MPNKSEVAIDRRVAKGERRSSGQFVIDDDINYIVLTVDRTKLPKKEKQEIAQVSLEVSLDNGGNWVGMGGMGFAGGEHISRRGLPHYTSSYMIKIPEGTNRVARIACGAKKASRYKIDIDQLVSLGA